MIQTNKSFELNRILMSVNFIHNKPVLFIQEIKAIAIGDLHIGMEYELKKSGVNIPLQIARMKREIDEIIEKTKAKRLVILGDIKHLVPGISYQEERDIPEFLRQLRDEVKVSVCLGNHDTYIKDIAPDKIDIYGSEGFKIKKYGFFHGHAWPAKSLMLCDYLITSHTHPTFQFIDTFGYKIVEPVWIKCKLNIERVKETYKIKKTGKLNTIIVPAFNKLLIGSPINSSIKTELIGPLFQNKLIDIKECSIYLLDGTYIGKIGTLNES